MTYEVKKGGRTYMSTRHESCRYPPTVEATVQAAGYNMKGVPRFGGTLDGTLAVVDWIYTRMKWV